MSNSLTNIQPKILARGLMTLRELAIMPRIVNSDLSAKAAEKGASIDVPIPSAVTATDVTPAATPPALVDTTPSKVVVNLNNWKEARFHLSDQDLGNIEANDHFLPMQTQEAVRALANAINLSVLQQYKGIYGYAGTAGTTPFVSTAQAAVDARQVLNEQLAPRSDRRGVLNGDAESNALLLGPFADASQTGENMVKIDGILGRKYGVDWYADDQVLTHTAGTITTGLASKSATAYAVGVETIVATTAASTGACALVEGDIIEFAGDSQTYTLTAAATQASAASDVTLTFSPPLKVAIASATPGVAITRKASHVVNMVFHRDAFALAMRPLASARPAGGEGLANITTLTDPQTGISMRLELSRQHKAWVWSFDVLWGVKLVRAALATRLAG